MVGVAVMIPSVPCSLSVGIGVTPSGMVFGLGMVAVARRVLSLSMAVAFAINLFKRGIVKGETSPLILN